MKLIAIGDIHGKTIWKEIVEENPDADKIVFVGDYFDGFGDPPGQIENFLEIVELKKKSPDRFVLLFGNHDFHYLNCSYDRYSGYQVDQAPKIEKTIRENLQYLQMAYKAGNYIFTHAGITHTWLRKFKIDRDDDIVVSINALFREQPEAFKFAGRDQYGDSPESSPIWVRPQSLQMAAIFNYNQVVGHTRVKYITSIPHGQENLIFIDVLDTRKEYLTLNID